MVAAAMPGATQGRAEGLEADLLVQADRLVHAGEGLQIAGAESQVLRHREAMAEQGFAHALAPDLRQEVHLPQLADAGIAALQGRDTTTADEAPRLVHHHEIGRPGYRVSRAHVIHLGIVDGEAGAIRPEFRHDDPDDGRHRGVVFGLDGAEGQHEIQVTQTRPTGSDLVQSWGGGAHVPDPVSRPSPRRGAPTRHPGADPPARGGRAPGGPGLRLALPGWRAWRLRPGGNLADAGCLEGGRALPAASALPGSRGAR